MGARWEGIESTMSEFNESLHILPTLRCPYPAAWTSEDRIAMEKDVAFFLGALVLALKPVCIVETGTYLGQTAEAMGRAAKENGFGTVYTLEVDANRVEQAQRRCMGLPVVCVYGDSRQFVPPAPIDLLVLDTEPELRDIELIYYRQWASPRCIIAVHDTAVVFESRFIEMTERLKALVPKTVSGWIELPTPRGLMLGQYA